VMSINRTKELELFLNDLWEYAGYGKKIADGGQLSKEENKRAVELNQIACNKSGSLGPLITELTGISTVDVHRKDYDMWLTGLQIPINKLVFNGLMYCIQVVNRAVGRLTDDIRMGIRDENGEISCKSDNANVPPKVFIAHGGKSGTLDKLCEFLEALGLEPQVVELLPSQGLSVDAKVEKYIHSADCGIVLATSGGIVYEAANKKHPRLNVIDEFARLRAAFPNKTVLLLEKGVSLPSNISGITYESFARQSMDRAFSAIARELTAFGILKAVKPAK